MPVSPVENFAADVRRFAPLSDAALDALRPLLQPFEYAADATLLAAGQRATWCFYVVQGLVREFHLAADGSEHTRAFASAGHFTGSLLDLLSGAPSVTWVQALEPTRVLGFRYAEFEGLCQRWPELSLLARRVVEQLYVRKAQREYQLLSLSAAQRYQDWCGQNAGLQARVSQRVLASFLGITPEHLSRLRRAS